MRQARRQIEMCSSRMLHLLPEDSHSYRQVGPGGCEFQKVFGRHYWNDLMNYWIVPIKRQVEITLTRENTENPVY